MDLEWPADHDADVPPEGEPYVMSFKKDDQLYVAESTGAWTLARETSSGPAKRQSWLASGSTF